MKKRNKKLNKKAFVKAVAAKAGFSLVELIIAVALLAAVVVPVMSSLVTSARTSARSQKIGEATDAANNIYQYFNANLVTNVLKADYSTGNSNLAKRFFADSLVVAEDNFEHELTDALDEEDHTMLDESGNTVQVSTLKLKNTEISELDENHDKIYYLDNVKSGSSVFDAKVTINLGKSEGQAVAERDAFYINSQQIGADFDEQKTYAYIQMGGNAGVEDPDYWASGDAGMGVGHDDDKYGTFQQYYMDSAIGNGDVEVKYRDRAIYLEIRRLSNATPREDGTPMVRAAINVYYCYFFVKKDAAYNSNGEPNPGDYITHYELEGSGTVTFPMPDDLSQMKSSDYPWAYITYYSFYDENNTGRLSMNPADSGNTSNLRFDYNFDNVYIYNESNLPINIMFNSPNFTETKMLAVSDGVTLQTKFEQILADGVDSSDSRTVIRTNIDPTDFQSYANGDFMEYDNSETEVKRPDIATQNFNQLQYIVIEIYDKDYLSYTGIENPPDEGEETPATKTYAFDRLFDSKGAKLYQSTVAAQAKVVYALNGTALK